MALAASITLWMLCVAVIWGCTAYAVSTLDD